jgi:hypothetical protein
LGDLVDFLAYKKRREIKEEVYGSYTAWITLRFLRHSKGATSRYGLALEAQQDRSYYLYTYFFPDFDW